MIRYVLITPAHNEEAFIAKTLQSVVEQTVRPTKWVIVNDGSTDRTADIILEFASKYPFITLVNHARPLGRHFGYKAHAFNKGLTEFKDVPYEFIGNLDADISLPSNYYENILSEFQANPKLGLAGGMVSSWIKTAFVSQNVSLDSVAGAVQLFRRGCFEELGSYLALPYGGIDSVAEIKARMNAWEVRTFPNIKVFEHRQTGTASTTPIRSRFKEGKRFYSLGYSPIFYCFRSLFRLCEPPFLIGSFVAFLGYISCWLRHEEILVPSELASYLRAEQLRKLKSKLVFWSKSVPIVR
jgi:biofilm PGA synthesis N-glycosyltransferase PgaC